jgi:lipopolysaccharide export system permease protein
VRARVLSRYLLRQNLFYLLTTLAVGTALYLMSDLFDRLDDFMEAGLGMATALRYFAVKIPLIISQIMPAVFWSRWWCSFASWPAAASCWPCARGGCPWRR